MGKTLTYRYPGAKPFATEEQAIFFGRGEDITRLYQLLAIEKLMVLHSRSGLGKSSLLNAGVIPRIRREDSGTPFLVRFGAWYAGRKDSPLSIAKAHLPFHVDDGHYLDRLLPGDESIWERFKIHQLHHPGSHRFLVFFDQFEELFTWPESHIHEFKAQLAELVYTDIPQRYRAALEAQEGLLTEEEIRSLYQPLDIHVVLAIRSDRLSLLDQLSDKLPDILKHRYELKALTPPQAEDAILNPAFSQEPGFLSPPFDYTDEALDKILRHLTRGGTEEIESFQLQIICQHAEMMAKAGNKRITPDDLGNLDHIFNNYYTTQISSLGDLHDQRAARLLIENGLIFEDDQRRLSLYEGQIDRDYQVSPELLRKLVDTHLIRSEPDPRGGFVYELSHDSLIAPILKAKKEREELERQQEESEIAEAERRAQEEALEKQRQELERVRKIRQLQRILIIFFVLAGMAATIVAVWAYRQKDRLDREVYNNFVSSGNLFLNLEDFQRADSMYQQAKYIARTSLTGDKVVEADQLIQRNEEMRGTLEVYKQLISRGDSAFEEKAYNKALAFYAQAINQDNLSRNRRAEAQLRIDEAEQEKRKAVELNKERGIRYFNVREYRLAYKYFLKAFELGGEDEFVTSRLEACERMLNLRR